MTPRFLCSVFRAIRRGLWVAIGVIGLGIGFAGAQSTNGFERYAVDIVRGPVVSPQYRASGAGIYMGKGLVLTAAHVAGRPTEMNPDTVVADERYAIATLVKAGSLDGVDVTLLSVDPAALPSRIVKLPPLSLCADKPIPGQTVTVVAPGNVRDSIIVSSDVLPPDLQKKLPTLIRDVYTTGNSGSGVFDPEIGCLMGIMSKKIERTGWRMDNGVRTRFNVGLAKYFVPALTIAEFLDHLL